MNKEMNAETGNGFVYIGLLFFTLLTVLASRMGAGRIFAILSALSIATVKSGLIALHYMHLKNEKPLIYGIALIGIVTASILAIGLFPDLAGRW